MPLHIAFHLPTTKDQWGAFVFATLALLSVIGEVYVFLGVCTMRALRKKEWAMPIIRNNIIVTTHVFWLLLSDIINFVVICINFIPYAVTGEPHRLPKYSCYVVGFLEQFVPLFTACWYFLIATTLFMFVIKKWNINTLTRNKKYHHGFAWILSLICSLIPLIPKNSYGLVKGSTRYQCWITDENYYLLLYIPILSFMMFDIGLLLYTWQILRHRNEKLLLKSKILKRLWIFVFMFVISWIFPMATRMLQVKYFFVFLFFVCMLLYTVECFCLLLFCFCFVGYNIINI